MFIIRRKEDKNLQILCNAMLTIKWGLLCSKGNGKVACYQSNSSAYTITNGKWSIKCSFVKALASDPSRLKIETGRDSTLERMKPD